MKVIVTPPGEAIRYPLVIRLIMLLPIARYKRRRLRSRALRRLKPLLLTFYNLPKRMPDDFAFTYQHQVHKIKDTSRNTFWFENNTVRKEVAGYSANHPAMNTNSKNSAAFSAAQRQELYDAIRKAGFIHFETDENVEVSYEVMVHTSYALTIKGREYYYSWSTTEPTRSEWGEEELELDRAINKIIAGASFQGV
jgi:hypothetical protein